MKQLSVDLAGLGILAARLLNQRQPWFGDDRCLGRVEHGAFGDGDDRVVAREALFELCDGRLKVVLAVGEAAATDHHVAQAGEIRQLSTYLFAFANISPMSFVIESPVDAFQSKY